MAPTKFGNQKRKVRARPYNHYFQKVWRHIPSGFGIRSISVDRLLGHQAGRKNVTVVAFKILKFTSRPYNVVSVVPVDSLSYFVYSDC